ncbi:hypothetical protein F4604DRAFT_1689608 [Suillus subluteus]|nr:hypothetical protein F4604DRAFT_1689608 [Suillus subluteus]
MQGCPPVAQRLQVLAPSGKSHFICNVNRRQVKQQTDVTDRMNVFNRSQSQSHDIQMPNEEYGRRTLHSDNQRVQEPATRCTNVRGVKNYEPSPEVNRFSCGKNDGAVRGTHNSPGRRSGGPKGDPKVRARVFVEADIRHQGTFGADIGEENENLKRQKIHSSSWGSIAEPKRWNVWGKTRAPDGKQVN